ncbi:DUF4173 domain-containing protein [Hymenobacter sp. BT683]|uniref:DUF4173 domain-containing protein n=1 Tax=Hymenobacter jeongseonensis TaxID=2791027 RepID=A0ABS0IIY1_9BACT|nr:DUF4173 domain-containing protein [Hymenobacter jeongseonensis]MBF9238334.1 DUF4173 domain-containing protein [Hymenobacter jeongseonensis]
MIDSAQASASWPAGQGPRPVSPAAIAASVPAAVPLTFVQKLLLPLGAVLFDWLFCLQEGGPNMFVFTVFVVAAQLVLLPKVAAVRRSGYFWLMVGGSLFSGAMMAVYGSAVAALACVASVLMLLGYVNQPHLKLVQYALLTAVGSVVQAGLRVLLGLRAPRYGGEGVRRSWYYARMLLMPLGVLAAFHILFAIANPRYLALFGRVMDALGEWLVWLLPELSVVHVVFLMLGLLVTAGVVVVVPVYLYADHESRFGEFIRRQRDRVASFAVRRPNFQLNTHRVLDLRKEFVAAVALFALVNVLLLVVNAIDINWLWFGFVPKPGFDLTQFVHEGTYVLIFSILLAMGIVLWFFRRNLNFYAPGLPWLRWGATVWVLQNAVLAVSVGLRNYYYIQNCGLAYKRIGVCFFLILVFFGLGTVLLKIWQRRSAYSLIRLNSVAVYAVLLLLAAGNWEVWIANYNLQSRFRSIDIGFLLNMPGRVLPTLVARREVISRTPKLTAATEYGGAEVITAAEAQRRLDAAVANWKSRFQTHPDWQGRTYADWRTAQFLQVQ